MFTLRRGLLGLTSVAAAIAIAACGSASKGTTSTATAHVSHAVLAQAADVSEAARGYTVRMSMVESIPGSGTFTIGGSGAFSSNKDGKMTMTMQGDGQDLTTQEIVLAPTIYVKEPPAVADKLPGRKPWMEIDFDQAGGGSYLSSLGSVLNSDDSMTSGFAYLQAESTHLEDLGKATVGGVPTTHYSVTVDLDRAGAGLPSSAHAAIQKLRRSLPGTILNETDVPMQVWIDSSHLVREMTFKMKLIPKGTKTTVAVSMKMLVTSYGAQPTPAAPPANQTLNLLTLLKAEHKTDPLISG